MTYTQGIEVYLRNTQNAKQELFIVRPKDLQMFRNELSQVDGKTCIEKADHDYKIARIALNFFGNGYCCFTSCNLINCLEAGHRYSSKIKETAKEHLVKKLIGEITNDELKEIVIASRDFEMPSLRPYILCSLLHMDQETFDSEVANQEWIDADMRNLATEFRATFVEDEDSPENARYATQTKINHLVERILAIKNRFDNVDNFTVSMELSNLIDCLEWMGGDFNLFVSESAEEVDDEPDLKRFEAKLNEAKVIADKLKKILPKNVHTENVLALLTCVEAMVLNFEGYKKDDTVFKNLIFGTAGNYLESLATQVGRSEKLREAVIKDFPEAFSVRTAQELVDKTERTLGIEMEKIGTFNSDRLSGASYIIQDGLEVRLINGLDVLWLSPASFKRLDRECIQRAIEKLGVTHLMVGMRLYTDQKPMLAYFRHVGNQD